MADKQVEKDERAPFLDTNEAAAILGLKASTLRVWRCSGKGPSYYKVGGAIRYKEDEIETWMAENVEHIDPTMVD